MRSRYVLACVLAIAVCVAPAPSRAADIAPPIDNPVAAYYDGDRGYPAWTDRIRWDRVIDMSAYEQGKTAFERFENARDELAAQGGGVLYYPAGEYDFSEGPFDGPEGRGLMLRGGVVIRGEAPLGKPAATDGRLDLPTKFIFGFTRRNNAVDAGERITLELNGGDMRVHKDRKTGKLRYEPAPLILSLGVKGDRVQSDMKGFRRGWGRDLWPGKAKVSQSGQTIKLLFELDVVDEDYPGKAAFDVAVKQDGDVLTGTFSGKCREQATRGDVTGRVLTITPETPRDWNLVGLMPEKGIRIKDVDTVGICWVQLVGATIWFGPDVEWGKTWATSKSWKSDYTLRPWSLRKPDGTHPWDPFAGGGKTFIGSGDGRLVFGCVLEQSCVTNESISMGRPDYPEGFGPQGYYMHKFGPRIGVYGSRVFVANNYLPLSRGRNFKYEQTTRYTYPRGGHQAGYDPPRKSVILFDYNKIMGVDVNKDMLGFTKESATGEAGAGYYKPGVVVVDNWVYNNGHKGFNVSGDWVTIAGNHNERVVLKEGYDPERIGGWELTLDGHIETSPGGPGFISDNLSRAFDLGGRNLWVHGNTYNNLGSTPGNDGEGILCQAHGGTQVYSWAVTYNKHDKGTGSSSYIGGWDVNMAGVLFGWNETAGWVGSITVGKRDAADASFIHNRCAEEKPMKGSQVGDPGGKLKPPSAVKAAVYEDDAVKITWSDAANNEVGFRVDRKIGDGKWRAIAYRPPQITGDPNNRPAWIDFTAPTGKPLLYRVVALNGRDNDDGASEPAGPVTLSRP